MSYYARTFGKDAVVAAMDHIPAELRADIGFVDGLPHLLPNVWYDIRMAHAMVDEMLGHAPAGSQATLARDAARVAVAESARGIYRFVLMQVASPELYARHVQRLWRLLHDCGTREIRIVSPGEADSEIRDWPGHHPLLCVFTNETMAALFEVMGARNVVVRRELCVSENAPICRTHISWTMR